MLLSACCYTERGASLQTLSATLAQVIGDTAIRDDRQRYLLDILETDGYLVEPLRGQWRFISPLLREFWRRRVAPPEGA